MWFLGSDDEEQHRQRGKINNRSHATSSIQRLGRVEATVVVDRHVEVKGIGEGLGGREHLGEFVALSRLAPRNLLHST